ncbi:DUF1737 domain-containing protein [Paraburkholderia sediminicola]
MPYIKFGSTAMSSEPPDGLPRYRLLTGMDDAAFCHRVSEALALGYQLYGSPNGNNVVVAQAIFWGARTTPGES